MAFLYTLTALLSAVLLFSVQPLIAKLILPVFGGTPAVWNTAMVFFQACLLAGYAYAHYSLKVLGWRVQGILHIALLAAATFLLPVALPDGWKPGTEGHSIALLSLLATLIGLPFFLVSASAPLLQRWFSLSDHPAKNDPYFLYAASNMGSMVALASYPLFWEPGFALDDQNQFWAWGFMGLTTVFLLCYGFLYSTRDITTGDAETADTVSVAAPTGRQKLRWIGFSALPSALLLAVTNHITTDMAVIPLLWVLPLMVYLLTFVIVFSKLGKWLNIEILSLIGMVLIMLASAIQLSLSITSYGLLLGLDLALLLCLGSIAHSRLAAERPAISYLTSFYLYMSLGGVLGGAAVALIAPVIFNGIYEYLILIVLATLMFPNFDTKKHSRSVGILLLVITLLFLYQYLFTWTFEKATITTYFLLIVAIFAGIFYAGKSHLRTILASFFSIMSIVVTLLNNNIITQHRSFFGVHRVVKDEVRNAKVMVHGNTNHGYQSMEEDKKLKLLSYYNLDYSFGDLKRGLEEKRATLPENDNGLHIAVAGLGSGNLACLGESNDAVTFFEIDQLVLDLASNPKYFTYLRDCPATINVVLGDARLTIKDQPAKKFDFLQLDAFSSDAIPLHLMTKEAMLSYLDKMKDDGFIVFHISNRHLNLAPVLLALSNELDLDAYQNFYDNEKYDFSPENLLDKNELVVISRPGQMPDSIAKNENWKSLREKYKDHPRVRVWTDDYANILAAYK